MEQAAANTNTNKTKNPSTNIDNNEANGGSFYKSGSQAAVSGIELIALQVVTYTSLKDLLPLPSSSPQAPATSPSSNNSSWNEVPIRNPLVKQAALAYLQPMSSPPPQTGDKGLLGRLWDGCCHGSVWSWWQCECFSWVNDVMLSGLREVFGWERRRRRDFDDDDEEDDEKVD